MGRSCWILGRVSSYRFTRNYPFPRPLRLLFVHKSDVRHVNGRIRFPKHDSPPFVCALFFPFLDDTMPNQNSRVIYEMHDFALTWKTSEQIRIWLLIMTEVKITCKASGGNQSTDTNKSWPSKISGVWDPSAVSQSRWCIFKLQVPFAKLVSMVR